MHGIWDFQVQSRKSLLGKSQSSNLNLQPPSPWISILIYLIEGSENKTDQGPWSLSIKQCPCLFVFLPLSGRPLMILGAGGKIENGFTFSMGTPFEVYFFLEKGLRIFFFFYDFLASPHFINGCPLIPKSMYWVQVLMTEVDIGSKVNHLGSFAWFTMALHFWPGVWHSSVHHYTAKWPWSLINWCKIHYNKLCCHPIKNKRKQIVKLLVGSVLIFRNKM